MSTRLEMLQVARLASLLLGESTASVSDFLVSEQVESGGFRGRDGAADLYYTVFGIDAEAALAVAKNSATQPAGDKSTGGQGSGDRLAADRANDDRAAATQNYLSQLPMDSSDLIHTASLVRSWTAVGGLLSADREVFVDALMDLQIDGGGWALEPGGTPSSYSTFLAVAALQDLGIPIPQPQKVTDFLQSMALDHGGYALDGETMVATTPTTVAAVVTLRQLGDTAHRKTASWLRARHHPMGGFLAAEGAPMPDLLSTAVALHALSVLEHPVDDLADKLLDFVDTLWTSKGSFFASWADDDLDTEYTYYGLLALGHLSVMRR